MGKTGLSTSFFPLVVAVMILVCCAEEKIWPDLSCHQHFENDQRKDALKEHKESWTRCQTRNNDTGPCAKTCQLRAFAILWGNGKKNTPVFDRSAAGKYFFQELGITSETYKIQAEGNKNITKRLDKCTKWSGRPDSKRNWDGPGCEGWIDILDCLDQGYGCSSSEFKHI